MSPSECVASFCSLSVPISVSVIVSLFVGALTYVAGLFSGMCISKRRFKTSTEIGKVPENSIETTAVYEEIDLHQVKSTDMPLTENDAYGEIK